jgi:GT2 family glycosyltransferase/lipopolysaccharide/colanic/teichoic acid biosynthesis glycosyltransferase
MDISIIIVTHNSISPIGECLESIKNNPPSGEHEIVIVDNASTDGTPSMIAERYPFVRLIASNENTGYSRGVNRGIRSASGKLLLVLNPDIVVREGSIDQLVRFMERTQDAGIIASKLIFPDGRLQPSCRRFYNLTVLLLRRTFLGKIFPNARPLREHLMMDYDHEMARKVDWVIGACMLVRREAIEKVGSMDERFFLYFEDIDWCYRMQHHGWAVYYVPESVMVHRYERSSAKSVFKKPFIIHILSMLRYVEKWNKIFYFLRRHRNALKSLVFILADIITINLSFLAAYYLRVLFQPFFTRGLYPIDWYFNFVLFYNMIYVFTFLFSGLYHIRRETLWSEELFRIVRATVLGAAFLMASTYLTKVRIFSRAVVLGQALAIIVASISLRQLLRLFHRQLVRADFDLKRVLLIGDKGEVEELCERLMSDPGLGIEIVGSIDSSPESLGSVDDIPNIVERFKVQEVFVLPSHLNSSAMTPLLVHSGRRMIQVRMVTPMARFVGTGVRVDKLAGYYMFSMERGAAQLIWRIAKRFMDMTVAILVLPFSAIFSLLYYVISRIVGRATFSSDPRRGTEGRIVNVPRIKTSSGGEAGDLFKAALFLHVLTGKMSLIGPPPGPMETRLAETGVDTMVYRPGITGSWRISPARSFIESHEEELAILQSRSVARDLIILARSLKFAFKGSYPEWFDARGEDR